MVFPQLFAFAATVGFATIAAIGLVYYLNNQSQPSHSYSSPRASPPKRSHISKYEPSDEDTVCTICLEQTKGMANRWILPCKHSFHVDCLRKWTVNKQECPNCRKQF